MKVFFTGSHTCPIPTLKRLMLLATSICFADRPSVTHGMTGSVGTPSPFRSLDSRGEPVVIEVYEPPSGRAGILYQRFIETDFANRRFIEIVVEGLRSSEAFTRKMIQLEADYSSGLTGAMMRDAITALTVVPERVEPDFSGIPYGIETRDPHDYLKWIMLEASIETTVAQLVVEQTDALPVSDDPIMGQLLALRSVSGTYSSSVTSLVPYLGVEFAKALMPDEFLQGLEFTDILEYRRATGEAYRGWQTELERAAAEIGAMDANLSQIEVARKVATDLMPKVNAYRAEVADLTDQFYGDALKNVVRLDVPSMLLGYMTGHGLAGAALSFASAAVAGVAVPAIQHVLGIRHTRRAHAVSYLVNVTN